MLVGQPSDAFPDMRMRLAAHFMEARPFYDLGFHNVVTMFDQLVLNTGHIGRVTHPDQWMELPMVGLAFATLYQRPLVTLSYTSSYLCLPMYSWEPFMVPQTTGDGIANVGQQNHFVAVSSQV